MNDRLPSDEELSALALEGLRAQHPGHPDSVLRSLAGEGLVMCRPGNAYVPEGNGPFQVIDLLGDPVGGPMGFVGQYDSGMHEHCWYATDGSWEWVLVQPTPPEPTVAELIEEITGLRQVIGQMQDQFSEQLGLIVDKQAELQRANDVRARQMAEIERELGRFHEIGTGDSAQAMRIIETAARAGFADVCVSTPETTWDERVRGQLTTGWTVTLGKPT